MLPIRPIRGLKRYEEHVDFVRYSKERRRRQEDQEREPSPTGQTGTEASFPYAKEAELHAVEIFARALAVVLGAAAGLKTALEAFDETRADSVQARRTVLSSHPEAATAIALPGAAVKSIRLEIRKLASPQLNRSALFAPDSPTASELGVSRIRIQCGELSKEAEQYVLSGNTHRSVLTRLRDTVNQDHIGILARLETDPATGRIRLALEGRVPGSANAFSLQDLTGNLAASAGLLVKDRTAADALIRVDGGAWTAYPDNRIPLAEHSLELELHGTAVAPVRLEILPDIRHAGLKLQGLARAVRTLEAELRHAADYINPSFAADLASATSEVQLELLADRLEEHYGETLRVLSGPGGLINRLQQLVSRMEAGPAEDLLNRSNSRYKRYANYLETLDWYSQLPSRGILLNRFF